MKKRMLVGLLGLFLGLCAGCKTTQSGFGLRVSNNSDVKVTDVEVRLDGRVAYQAAQLKPREIMLEPLRIGGGGPAETLVRWKNTDGEVVEKVFKPETALARNFKGQIDMEIKSATEVAMFSVMREAREGSVIPWNIPEAWEGSPSIPGLSSE